MPKILPLLFLASAALAWGQQAVLYTAQPGAIPTAPIAGFTSGTDVPGSCSGRAFFLDTDDGSGALYVCSGGTFVGLGGAGAADELGCTTNAGAPTTGTAYTCVVDTSNSNALYIFVATDTPVHVLTSTGTGAVNIIGEEGDACGDVPVNAFCIRVTDGVLSIEDETDAAISNTIIPTTATANQFLTHITSGGVQTKAQPAFSDLSGSATDSQIPDNITIADAAVNLGDGTLEIPNSTSLPGTCTVGQVYFDSDATAGSNVYGCTATNTWTLQAGGGGGDGTTLNLETSGLSGTDYRGAYLVGSGLTPATLYMSPAGTAVDADSSSTMSPGPCFAVTGTNCLVHGVYKFSSSQGWTALQTIYASATAGGLTTTAPSSNGQYVQVLGIALANDTIYFAPSPTIIGLGAGGGGSATLADGDYGDIVVSSTGTVISIDTGVIVNADINASAAIALSKLAATTASRALVSDGSGFITTTTTTATEIGYVNGVTSAIQTQLDAKLPLAGGTLTGQLITDNLGIEFEDSDTNPTCAAGNYTIYADLSETKLKKCVNGTASDLDTGGDVVNDTTPQLGGTLDANGNPVTGLPYISFGTTNPADGGVARLENNTTICWEAATPGTDLCFKVNASDKFEFSAPIVTTGTAASYEVTEIAAPGAHGTAGLANLYIDSTTHLLSSHTNGQSLFTYQTPGSSATFTNKIYDAEGTGNTLTTVQRATLMAAGGTAAAPFLMWNALASNAPTPTCAAGSTETTLLDCYASFPDSDGDYSLQVPFFLPSDWTGNIDLKFKWKTSATSGDVVWQATLVCRADGEVNDAAFNTPNAVTDTAKGTTLQLNDASITSMTTTGCAAGELATLKVLRNRTHASDSLAAAVLLEGVELTMRRAQ